MKKWRVCAAVVFLALAQLSLTSCVTALVMDGTEKNSKPSSAELLKAYADARWKAVYGIAGAWAGKTEKELVYAWGAPTYAQTFSDNERLLIYQTIENTTTTTGGNSVTQYDKCSDKVYTTKEAETTTTREKKTLVKATIKNGIVESIDYDGYLSQVEGIVQPSDDYGKSEIYAQDKADISRKEAAYDKKASQEKLRDLGFGFAGIAEASLFVWLMTVIF
jgi:hypothetical protein